MLSGEKEMALTSDLCPLMCWSSFMLCVSHIARVLSEEHEAM